MNDQPNDGSPYNKDLPLVPNGFKSQLVLHLSYEANRKRCGKAVHSVIDADGVLTPISRRYDTHPTKGYDGYFVDGCDEPFKKWADAAKRWNQMRADAMLAAREAKT